MMAQTEWDELVAQLPKATREKFSRLLRRALRRRIEHTTRSGRSVPESVRTAAVGAWRKRHAATMSKAALRRMSYTRLRNKASYRSIEDQLMERYLARHAQELKRQAAHLDTLSLSEACEAYRDTVPDLAGSSLASLAHDVCSAACPQAVRPQEVRDALAAEVCAYVRTHDLSACARVSDEDPVAGGRYRTRPFDLGDASTKDEVVARLRSARLVEGVLAELHAGRSPEQEAGRRMAAQVLCDKRVRIVEELLCRLFETVDPLDAMLLRMVRGEAREVDAYLRSPAFARLVADALLENERYRKPFAWSVEIKRRVRESVPTTPMDAYPLARTMRRHFVLHVGPTNSGKTHDALTALQAAASGAYLGPLRLLAYEQFEALNHAGCPCTLRTGEELCEVAGARHVSSTVEMADLYHEIDVAVIDEAQMICDPDRGQHWTSAILGIPAHEVHVCCAPHADQVVRELVALCDDGLEVVRHERLVPLDAERGSFRLPEDVRAGDALIVFSRKAVHAVAAEVAAFGLRPSVVYGALPHDVRHEEARRFDAGETDVVVATDAIGMGMNLPIRRIVFVEQRKFDGHVLRALHADEVQQIAGRAGRFGRYERGLYQSTRKRKELVRLMGEEVPDITTIPVGIPADIALVRDVTLTSSILQWASLEQPVPFQRIDVRRDLALIAEAEALLRQDERSETDVKVAVLRLATMPFDETDRTLHDAWRQMARAELRGEPADLSVPDEPQASARLVDLEASYRYCDLLYTYARAFGHPEQQVLLTERREQISRVIMGLLAASSEGVG